MITGWQRGSKMTAQVFQLVPEVDRNRATPTSRASIFDAGGSDVDMRLDAHVRVPGVNDRRIWLVFENATSINLVAPNLGHK